VTGVPFPVGGASPTPAVLDGATLLEAEIVAVTVFPDRARVTRRARVELPPGEQRVVFDDLPLVLITDSVRVAGVGPATVLGVDVARQYQMPRHYLPGEGDEITATLERQLREARAELASLQDEEEVATERLEFLTRLGRRATAAFARALAAGQTDPAAVGDLGGTLAAQQAEVRAHRRELAERRIRTEEQIAAYERGLEARRRQREPDRMAATVSVAIEGEPGAAAAVDLELSYLVDGAGWHSTYDLRLDGESLHLTWFGMVTQHTGEDWPECDLRLSTARPSGEVLVPELDPWFLDRMRQPQPRARAAKPMSLSAVGAVPPPASMPVMSYAAAEMDVAESAPMLDLGASVEQGVTAATYQPARPVAVPADGASHRATIAVIEFEATLDYITAPVRSAEAHLRAKVVNSSEHTLLPGQAAVFHGGDFVGSTALEIWATGEEVELALGVDDRVRIERELVRRTATRAVLSTTRRREAEHRIRVTNHSPRAAKVTVLDQLPVSRDEGIVVKELRLDPAPVERTDLGVLTWVLDLAEGQTKEIHIGVRVELARGVELLGWRE
jgi:uncharacterized protein (TIGR02231 family)